MSLINYQFQTTFYGGGFLSALIAGMGMLFIPLQKDNDSYLLKMRMDNGLKLVSLALVK